MAELLLLHHFGGRRLEDALPAPRSTLQQRDHKGGQLGRGCAERTGGPGGATLVGRRRQLVLPVPVYIAQGPVRCQVGRYRPDEGGAVHAQRLEDSLLNVPGKRQSRNLLHQVAGQVEAVVAVIVHLARRSQPGRHRADHILRQRYHVRRVAGAVAQTVIVKAGGVRQQVVQGDRLGVGVGDLQDG